MLFILAVTLGVLSLILLVFRPYHGILFLIASKPIIDTAFYKLIAFNLSITRGMAVMIPFLIVLAMLRAAPPARLSKMPLKSLWLIYVVDIFLFSSHTVINAGIVDGMQVFFRHMHGFVGFYMIQAFFHDKDKLKQLLQVFLLAGIFPIAAGMYQMATGQILSPLAGGDVVEGLQRSVGFYHDVFTVRYYALQTLIAMLLYWAIYLPRKRIKIMAIIGYALMAVGVVFKAYTKSGLVTIALWSVIWTVSQKKFVQLAIILGAVFLVSIYFADTIVADIARIFRKEIGAVEGNLQLEDTFEGRWYGWSAMLGVWADLGFMKQVFGSGILMVGAHNDYIQMLFHGGLLGLTIYVTLLAVNGLLIMRNLFEKVEPLRVAALMLFVMYMIDTIGLVPSSYVGYQWLVWGFIGLSFRMRAEDRSRRIEALRQQAQSISAARREVSG